MLAAAMGIAVLIAVAANEAQAQTISALYNFSGGTGGQGPGAGITFDRQGNIYGTTEYGGSHQNGLVYRLARHGEGWVYSPLYSFGSQQDDGAYPLSRVIVGPDGVLYGATTLGGINNYGTVFGMTPPPTVCKTALCPWVETVIYRFTGGADGREPWFGDLAFDQAGNIYGTTIGGGSCCGVVFKLTRSGSGWTESVVWNFTDGNDGASPMSGVIFDSAGNIYGTTNAGGSNGFGTVYELSPTQSGWSETTLYSFTAVTGPGAGALVMDAQGDVFGITGGADESVSVAYELTPQNGGWSFSALQNFGIQEAAPTTAATLDSQGNLYGPMPDFPDFLGEIFKLTRSGNQWIYSPYYQFDSCQDGCNPATTVTFDANGNMYGTSYSGGSHDGDGVVWEITP